MRNKYLMALAMAGTAIVMADPAFAQAAGNTSDISADGLDPKIKIALVVGGILALIGVVTAASLSIETFWKGHQKAKQTVKKL